MKDYIEYDEEQFYYLDKKPEQKYNGATEAICDAGENIIYGAFKFLTRADLVSSCLLALVAFLLTYKNAWPWFVYVIGAVAIIFTSLVLQYALVIFRIIYSIFACGAIAVLATTIIGHDTTAEMHRILGISFVVALIWAVLSWKSIKKSNH